jgi:hypothetical protein
VDDGIGGGRDRGHLEVPGARAAVERLDVLDHVLDLETRGPDLAGGERVEHEGVVGIGAVADTDQHGVSL